MDEMKQIQDFLSAHKLEGAKIAYDSRKIEGGEIFVAIKGFDSDGADFLSSAAEKGAVAVVINSDIALSDSRLARAIELELPILQVADTRKALADLSVLAYNDPSRKLSVFGITGTNGKTTTTFLLDSICRYAGKKTGLIGTVETRIGDSRIESERTTPESLELQELLKEMVDQDVDCVSIEVSSHAIDLKRVQNTRFAAVAFTNISQDHLDYHADMAEYFSVKEQLFWDFEVGARVVSTTTKEGAELAARLSKEFEVFTVGRAKSDTLSAIDEVLHAHATEFKLAYKGKLASVYLPIPGSYNVENALVAAGLALSQGLELETVAEALCQAEQIPGRLERVLCGQDFEVVVDYAHTPDSIAKAVLAMKELAKGEVIAVFGCGGDRDPSKRPLMAQAAANAHFVVATSDNPRTEDPASILEQVVCGFDGVDVNYEAILDRKTAIHAAIKRAKDDDVVIIMGKGHEDYQILGKEKIHFDDREQAREALRSLGYQEGEN